MLQHCETVPSELHMWLHTSTDMNIQTDESRLLCVHWLATLCVGVVSVFYQLYPVVAMACLSIKQYYLAALHHSIDYNYWANLAALISTGTTDTALHVFHIWQTNQIPVSQDDSRLLRTVPFALCHGRARQKSLYTMCPVQRAQYLHSLVQTKNRSSLQHPGLKNKILYVVLF